MRTQVPNGEVASLEARRRGRERIITLSILFVLVFILDLSIRAREVADKSLDLQVLSKVVIWGLAALWAGFHYNGFESVFRRKLLWPWLALIGWLALTAIVSIAPGLTLVSAFSLGVCLIFLLFCLRTQGETRTVATIVAAITLFLVVSSIFYFLLPELTRSQAWSGRARVFTGRLAGLTPAPNVIGRMAGFSLMLSIVYFTRIRQMIRWLPLISIVMAGTALLMAQSRTTMFAVAVAVLAWWFVRRANRWVLPILATGVAVGNFLILPNLMSLATTFSRSGDATEILTLTNRTYIWRLIWWFFEQKPLFGWGYNTCGLHMAIYARQIAPELGGYTPPHPHNALLQMLFSGGVIAFILFVVALIMNAVALHKQAHRAGLALFFFWVSTTLTESGGFAGVAGVSSLAMFFPLGLACLAQPERFMRRRRNTDVESGVSTPGQPDDEIPVASPVDVEPARARVHIENLD